MGTSVPQGLFWMYLRTQSGGASSGNTLHGGGQRSQRRAAVLGDREPRPGSREQEKGLRLGHQRASPSTVSAKEPGEALGIQQVGFRATGPPLQTPGPKAPPSPLPLETGPCRHRSAPSPACPSRLQGTCRPFANHPSSDLPSPLGLFLKLKYCFLKGNLLTCFKIKLL